MISKCIRDDPAGYGTRIEECNEVGAKLRSSDLKRLDRELDIKERDVQREEREGEAHDREEERDVSEGGAVE